jgi:tRNA G26 N,N-dimethylase Trm1
MRTILQINQQDINEQLLQTIKMLMLQNSEILIQPFVDLEEYDSSQSIENVMQALKATGYNAALCADIEQGLKTSTVYADNEH